MAVLATRTHQTNRREKKEEAKQARNVQGNGGPCSPLKASARNRAIRNNKPHEHDSSSTSMVSLLVSLCLLLTQAEAVRTRDAHGIGRREAEPAPILLPLRAEKVAPSLSLPHKLRFHHNVSLTVPVAVGTPPQNVSMVLDTGSELSWLLCNATSSPLAFNAASSSSYGPLPCSSPACQWQGRDLPEPPSCNAPPSNSCRVSLTYADASTADGLLAGDVFLLGGGPPVPALFGCMSSSYDSTTNATTASGLLGMNRGNLSFVTQTGTRRFAYCIAGGDDYGVLLLGGGAEPPFVAPLNYTPLIQISEPLPYFDRVAYTVQLEGIRVGSTVLPIPKSVLAPDHTGAGQTMVDSGTQFTFLLGEAYGALKSEFLNQTRGLLAALDEPDFVFQGAFDTCFRSPEAAPPTGARLPEVALLLRGAEVAVPGERLLYEVPGERRRRSRRLAEHGGQKFEADTADAVWCLTFGNSEMVGMTAYVIGHHHQQDVWVEYDLQNGRVGFAPARCDLAARSLGVSL